MISLKDIEILNELEKRPIDSVKEIFTEYICRKNLQIEYLDIIPKLAKNYSNEAIEFIKGFKRAVNALYMGEKFDKNIFENVDIDKYNWFWYARILKYTEDENFPKSNFLQPSYLLSRLEPIIKELDPSKLDEELTELYNISINLMKKYLDKSENL